MRVREKESSKNKDTAIEEVNRWARRKTEEIFYTHDWKDRDEIRAGLCTGVGEMRGEGEWVRRIWAKTAETREFESKSLSS